MSDASQTVVTTNKIGTDVYDATPEQIEKRITKRISDIEAKIETYTKSISSLKEELKKWKKFKLEKPE